MHVTLKHPATGLVVSKPSGFSWTTFFFGGLPALFRSDFKHFIIQFLLVIPTLGLSALFYAFKYNKFWAQDMLLKGYVPADEQSVAALGSQGIIANIPQ